MPRRSRATGPVEVLAPPEMMAAACEPRQLAWPTPDRLGLLTDEMRTFIRSTFCIIVKPKDHHTQGEMIEWLTTNIGPQALMTAARLAYWTEGTWAASMRETHDSDDDAYTWDVFEHENSYSTDEREGEFHVLFLTRRDAVAFKMVFG